MPKLADLVVNNANEMIRNTGKAIVEIEDIKVLKEAMGKKIVKMVGVIRDMDEELRKCLADGFYSGYTKEYGYSDRKIFFKKVAQTKRDLRNLKAEYKTL